MAKPKPFRIVTDLGKPLVSADHLAALLDPTRYADTIAELTRSQRIDAYRRLTRIRGLAGLAELGFDIYADTTDGRQYYDADAVDLVQLRKSLVIILEYLNESKEFPAWFMNETSAA